MSTRKSLRTHIENITLRFKKLHPTSFSLLMVGLVAITASWLFVEIAEDLVRTNLIEFDTSVITFIYGFRQDSITAAMNWFSILGYQFLFFFAAGIVVYLVYKSHYYQAIYYTLTVVLGGIVNTLVKDYYQRGRPMIAPLAQDPTYSFPSGHSMGSTIVYGAAIYLILKSDISPVLKSISSAFLVWLILMIGVSRVYLGMHYPTDVIGGYLCGLIWLAFAYIIFICVQPRKFNSVFESKTKKSKGS